MELTAARNDALTELIHIGYARAAAAWSDLTGHRIALGGPAVALHTIPGITGKLRLLIKGKTSEERELK